MIAGRHTFMKTEEFPRRKSLRLDGYDYTRVGAYFVTIVASKRVCLFGKVVNGVMELSKFGQIALQQWTKLPRRFPHIELGEYAIMPNHMHGIIIIVMRVGARRRKPGTLVFDRPAVPLPWNGSGNLSRGLFPPLCVLINLRLRCE